MIGSDLYFSVLLTFPEAPWLEVQLQKRIAYGNLELEAARLGMCKPEKDDVVYIRVNDKNAAQTADGFVESEE